MNEKRFASETSTATFQPGFESAGIAECFAPAVAHTDPANIPPVAWTQPQNGQLAKSLASKILHQHKVAHIVVAWGAGARASAGVAVPYPSPPYPPGATWA